MRYNNPIRQTPINSELGPTCDTYSAVTNILIVDYERNSLYVFLNTPPNSELGHSWDIYSVAINNERLLTSSIVAYVQ
jgi:hypothetical protein